MRLLAFLSLLWAAAATHFAFGTIYWYRVVQDPTVFTRVVTFEIAWRRNFPDWLSQLGNKLPVVGSVLNVGSLSYTPRSGSGVNSFTTSISYVVYSWVDVNTDSNGWIYGIYNTTQTLNPAGDPWTINFNGCCRLSTLLDGNNDNSWNVNSLVTSTNRQRGPRSTGAARQYVAVNNPIIFYIPANLYTGAAATVSTFSRASARYSSALTNDMPSFGRAYSGSANGAMTISTTVPGQLLWTPSTVGLFAMAFAIWDTVDYTPLDFIMQVLVNCNSQPFFTPLLAPTPQIFYKNIESTFQFSTSSSKTGTTTFATWTVLPTTASITQLNRVGATTTYEFKWAPSISDVSTSVCIQAVDSAGLFNCNSYCIALTIKNADIIYASGIIRDFSKVPIGSPAALRNTDFARSPTPNDYPGTRFVSGTLGSDSLPVYSASTTPQTTSSATFNQWYRTINGINIPLVYSRTLSDIVGNGVYTWKDTQWWPIDTQGFGNEGDAHNNYFTWEVHTYITYNSSHKYTFISSDDLWVYFNGQLPANWNLQGLHSPAANFTVDMSAAQWKNSLVEGYIYPADIFYAHRSTGSTPGLQLQLPKADLCNALSVGEKQFNYQFSDASQFNNIFMTLVNSYSTSVAGTFSLMANVVPGTSVAAYAGIQGSVGSVLIKVLQGFETYFTFKVNDAAAGSFSKGCEGFAFLMQRNFWNSVGYPASSLGYGGLPNSVAVEFDMNPNTAGPCCFDPPYQHLALHTRYNDTNCANSTCMIASSNNDPVLTMTNNTWHTVRMQYIPAQQGTTGIKQGWVYIWMNTVLAPVLAVPLLSNRLFDAFLGAAYVGFSAASSTSFGGNIQIQQWNITIVTISAAQTYIMGPTTVVAGNIGTLTIQSRDACGNNLLVGEEQSRFTVTVVKRFVNGYGLPVALPVTVPVLSNHDGTYSVPLNVTVARAISVYITLDGIPLQNSPYNMDIIPGPTSRQTTTFYISDPLLPVRWDQAPGLNGIYAAQINPLTGNVVTTMQCDLGVGSAAASWTNCATYLSAGSSTVLAAVAVGTIDTSNSGYASLSNTIKSLGAQFSYTKDYSWALLTKGTGTGAANIAAECVSISEFCSISASFGTDPTTGGSLFYVNATSGGTNTGDKRAAIWAAKTNPQFTVGTNYAAVFVIIARDAFGNLNTAGGDGLTYGFSPDIVSGGTGMISTPVNYPGTFAPSFDAAFYVAAWSTTKAGPYQLYISISVSGVMQGIAQTPTAVVVLAGPPSPFTSSVVGDGRSTATAGLFATFNIQLADQYNNRLVYPPQAGVVTASITLPGNQAYNPATTFPFTWTSSSTGPNVYWFYQVTYNITTTGNMPLGVYINGVLLTDITGQQITVVPGALSARVSQIALDSSFTINPPQTLTATSGVELDLFVQAKDAFGNIRPYVNAAGDEFIIRWNGVATTLSPLGGSYTSTYLGSGVYQLAWTPVTVGSVVLRVVSNGNTVYTVAGATGQPANGYPLNVVAGPAAYRSYLSVAATSTAPTNTATYYSSVSSPQFYAVAGVTGTASVFSVDTNGNLRTCCDDSSNAAFLVAVKASSAVRATVSGLQRVGTTNQYTISFNATVAYAWYDVQVSTSFDGQQLFTSLGAVPKVYVLPASTNPYRCTVGGPGASGALAGASTVLSIQAKDAFDNFQAHWSDVFTVTVVDNFGNARPVTVVPVIPSPLPSPVVGGLFSANFTIPTGSTSYNVSVATQGVVFWRGTFLPVFTSRPFLYFQNVATPTSTVLPAGNANGNTKPYGTWIRQVNSVGQVPVTTAVFASAQLTDSTDQPVSVSVTVQAWSTVAPALQIADANTASLYYVAFGAQRIGMFKLNLVANGFTAQVALPSTGLPNVVDWFNVSIAPGDLSPPNSVVTGLDSTVRVVAGQVGTFSAVLKDSFLNTITLTTYTITASSPTTNSFTLTKVTNGVVGADFTWNGEFTATVAGVQQITVAANGNNLGQGSYSVTIIPAAVSGPNSTVTLGSTLVAGSPAEIFISLFDQYGNAVDDSAAVFTITASNLNTPDFAVQYQGLGVYKATFTPTLASTYPLTAVYGAINIGTPLNLNVLAGPWATVTPISNPTAVAGNLLTMQFAIKDAYNNAWGGDAARLRATATIGTSTYSATVTGTAGTFVATLVGVNTRKAGNYSWDLKIDNVPSGTTFPTSVVVPGPIDPTQTGLPVGTLPVLGAGKWQEISLVLRDTYGNDILGGFDGAQSQIVFLNGSAQCKSDAEAANDTIITSFSADNANGYGGAFFRYQSPSTLFVKYTSTTPGLYTVVFSYNQVSIPCTRYDRMYQKVIPGDPNPLQSSFTPIAPATITAGVYFDIAVQIRDAFGNPTQLNSLSDLALVPTGLASARFAFATGQTQTANIGEYVVSAVIYQAGQRDVTLSLPTGNFNQSQSLLIIPAEIQYWAFQSNQARAGVPFAFSIAGTDAYNNPVDVSQYSFIVQLQIQAKDLFGGTYADQTLTAAQVKAITDAATNTGITQCSLIQTCTTVYTVANTTVTYDAASNTYVGTALSTWYGKFMVTVSLASATGVYPQVQYLYIPQATCAFETPTTPFRCASGNCVATYSSCSPAVCADNTVLCGGQCAASASACTCPPNAPNSCPGGYCSDACPSTSTIVCPSWAQFKCPTPGSSSWSGQCRQSAADCPSAPVCAPGYVLCSDSQVCVASIDKCPNFVSVSPGCSGVKCADGRCVAYLSDCPTPVTCKTGVLCGDGSCQASAQQCPAPSACYTPTPWKCVDGSCRANISDCPSGIVCPVGWVLCESRQCSQSVSGCPNVTKCSSSEVRCPDGSCRSSFLLCPSQVTCPPTAPVLCPDRSCVQYAFSCPASSICPLTSRVCPDGSCVQWNSDVGAWPACPTTTTCSVDTPVLCQDGSCQVAAANCPTNIPTCPLAVPVRCPDGSCKGNLLDCPSVSVCPNTLPVRCVDGKCVASADLCPSTVISCPSGQTRCPGGECAAALALCPTHVTCPAGFERCADGTCRQPGQCAAVAPSNCTIGTVACPQAVIGYACATSLADCPQAPVCPINQPVRCIDLSCRDTVSRCPPPPSTYKVGSVPCPDGSFSASYQTCPTPVTCPLETPYKCFDQTCRVAPTDCPTPRSCPSGSVYLCPNGGCTDRLDNCQSSSTRCDGTSVKCPDGTCAPSVSVCPPVVSNTNTGTGCPDGSSYRCRDGTCATTCPSITCPITLPYLCSDGMCAQNSTYCNSAAGCPWYAPNRCYNGQCVASLSSCPATPPCPTGYDRCPSGLCVASALSITQCPEPSGCLAGQLRCFDGTCVTLTQTATGTINPCINGSAPGYTTLPNSCPFSHPYRCDSGYCAVSSSACPAINGYYCTNASFPIPCADGSCVQTSSQCPLVKPCASNQVRCPGNGQCINGNDTSICPPYSMCAPGTRCANGLCAPTAADCPLDATGCPAGYLKCPNGQCAAPNSSCNPLASNGCSNPSFVKCSNGDCVANAINCPYPNGCPYGLPYKCPATGACVSATAQCATSTCTGKPVVCGDGTCVATTTQCTSSNGCPANKPIRCANGACQSYPATDPKAPAASKCPVTVSCTSGKVLCANGQCADANQFCPPVLPCPSPKVQCADGTCKANSSQCSQYCPPTSPITCSSGLCTRTTADCGVQSNTFKCADGRVVTCLKDCITWGNQLRDASLSSSNAALEGYSNCPSGYVACWDGSCGSSELNCPIIPACPLKQYRYWNGSCSTVAPPDQGPKCPSGLIRCEDGMCRLNRMPFDGCALFKYYCSNRECVDNPSQCDTASVPNGRRALQQSGPVVCNSTDCNALVKAVALDYTVAISQASEVVIAINSQNVAVGRLSIPDGSIGTPGQPSVVLHIRPVAESEMRSAQNALPPSRRAEFGNKDFTFAQTVISSSFRCYVDSTVTQPFTVPVTYYATIDYQAKPDVQDVCLAYLFVIGGTINYRRWQCLMTTKQRRVTFVRDLNAANPDLVRDSFSDCQNLYGAGEGKIYAFIHAPLSKVVTIPPQLPGWWQRNALWITLVFLALGILVLLILYAAKRLYRYRKKYKEEQARVNQKKEEVEEMEQFGGGAGVKDDEVAMTANPLTLQLKDMQRALEEKESERNKELERQKKEQNEARKEHIDALTSDRDHLMAELEKLKAELENQQKAQALAAKPRTADEEPANTSGPATGAAAVTTGGGAAAGPVKTNFQAAKPKRKDL